MNVELIRRVVSKFYERAFADPIIGHFFFNKDHASLIEKQTEFARNMLGDHAVPYSGRPLTEIHHTLAIRRPHFMRRKVLMEETLTELGVEEGLKSKWLRLEDRLRSQIVK